MIIQQEVKQKTCIDYSPGLLGGEVGLLLIRSDILGNEVSEKPKRFPVLSR